MGKRERKKERSKRVWMSIILAFIMVFSVFGVIIGSQSSELKFGKHSFDIVDSMYVTKVEGKSLSFYTLPPDVAYINLSSIVVNKIKESFFVMIVFNASSQQDSLQPIELARFDIAQLLGPKTVISGVIEQSGQYPQLDVVGCRNATLKTPVIVFNVSDRAGIIDVDNCIFLNGRGADFLRLRDRLMYSYYGVINDS